MGIIDDYYGGYETLAMFTNYDTDEVDFESAYNYANFGEGFSFPNFDSDEFEDEEEKAEFYKIMGELRATGERGVPGAKPGRNGRGAGRGAGARRGGRGGGRGSAATAAGGPVPGWEPTGQYTLSGQQLFSGTCSSCGEKCTVPFKPVQGRSPPCCRSCHSASKQQSESGDTARRAGSAAAAVTAAAPSDGA